MLIRKLFLLATLALLLGACAGGQPAATTLPTSTQVAQTSTPAPSAQTVPGCTVASPQPTPGATEQSLFPPVGAEDWVKGPADAYLTFIEYGDFM
jgi:hypothetical protein